MFQNVNEQGLENCCYVKAQMGGNVTWSGKFNGATYKKTASSVISTGE